MFHTLMLLAAVTVPAIPAGTYTYHGSIAGAPSGTMAMTVSAPDAKTLALKEASSGIYQGITATAKATLTLSSDDFSPVAYTATYQGAGQSGTTTLTFANGAANETSPMGPRSYTLPSGVAHFSVIDGALLAGFMALPMQVRASNASSIFAVAPIYMQAVQLSVSAVVPQRPATVPASDASLNITGAVPFTIWYDPKTSLLDELDVPSQQIVVTRDR